MTRAQWTLVAIAVVAVLPIFGLILWWAALGAF
jgi:hypothetical protein